MRKFWLFMLLCLLIFSGCSKTSVEDAAITPASSNTPADLTPADLSPTESNPLDETYSDFISNSPSLVDLSDYIRKNIDSAPLELSDQMLQDWIVMLDLSSSERDNVFYSTDSEIYFNALYDTAHTLNESYGPTLFMGNTKEEVASQVKELDVKNYLKALYAEGYGLMSSEGLFYAYPDYIYILNHYGQYASSSLNQYLQVMVSEIQEPLFAEESLNVSVETLFQRTFHYEILFSSTQDINQQLRMNLAGLLNMCYYRLLVPSSYDMLDDEHRVSESLKAFYKEASTHTDTPLTAALCVEMLSYFNEKNDILNVFDDPSIYEHANQYFEDVLGNSLNAGE